MLKLLRRNAEDMHKASSEFTKQTELRVRSMSVLAWIVLPESSSGVSNVAPLKERIETFLEPMAVY